MIPARFAARRLPGKPLLDLGGKPMIRHVHERAAASGAERVIVATDDERVARAARAFGAEVCVTRRDHASGTERLAEVAALHALDEGEIIVNVQGDEPFLPPANIDQVAANLAAYRQASMATLAEPIAPDSAELRDPAAVKVVTDAAGYALYFSRAAIPAARDPETVTGMRGPWLRHVGIYAYRAGFLRDYVAWGSCALERLEALEQLRVLWHGHRIHVGHAREQTPPGIDTPADYERARRAFD